MKRLDLIVLLSAVQENVISHGQRRNALELCDCIQYAAMNPSEDIIMNWDKFKAWIMEYNTFFKKSIETDPKAIY